MTCSAVSALDEPLPGTATVVRRWLCIEHPGAWGTDIVTDAPLGREVTDELNRRCIAAGIRLMLIRRPGRLVQDDDEPGSRQVIRADSTPGDSWCEQFRVSSAEDLLDLAFEDRGVGAPVAAPVVLVCSHGKRDQCCARLGRPIAAGLAQEYPGFVWECSHTGGHRFAPSMILLPSGYSYGRVDIEAARQAVESARKDTVSMNGLRGRSYYTASAQVADSEVRQHLNVGIDELVVEHDGDDLIVRHNDGRAWGVEVAAADLPAREVSCGASPKPVTTVTVRRTWQMSSEN